MFKVIVSLLGVINTILYCYAGKSLYNWFIATIFSLPTVSSLWEVYGIFLLINLISLGNSVLSPNTLEAMFYSNTKSQKLYILYLFYKSIMVCIIWGIGYIIHLFI